MFGGQHYKPEYLKMNEFTMRKCCGFFFPPSLLSGRCVNGLALHIAHKRGSLCVNCLGLRKQMLFRHTVKQKRSCI